MKLMAMMLVLALALSGRSVAAEYPPLPRPYPKAAAVPVPAPVLPRPSGTTPISENETEAAEPDRIYRTACPAVLQGLVMAEAVPAISDGACGLRSPYRVTGVSIGGRAVGFSGAAVVNCQMAGELSAWLARVDTYVQSVFRSGLVTVKTGPGYMCRGRNRVVGADISEHGFGNALDVMGFVLADGTEIGLPGDWSGDDFAARTMQLAHDTACGHFTTVLGPETNALHADHLHLDLGCHGQSCTYQLCE